MAQVAPPAGGFTVSADLIRGIIDCAEQCGVAHSRLSDMISRGRSDTTSSAPPVRYFGEHILKLWDRIMRESGDPIIGFRMALAANVRTFGALGQILPRCPTLLEAYRQIARYSALASQAGHVAVGLDANALTISLAMPNLPSGQVPRTIWLWGLTNLVLVPFRLAGANVRPKVITCSSPAPPLADVHVLNEHFPFRFNSSENQVVFDRTVGEITIPSADADLQLLVTETMDRHLAALGPAASFEQGMLTVLRSMMDGNMPTLASLSLRSGISQRTLQRRLAEAKTTFQRLLRQVLHEMSDELLGREELSHGEIAFLLGYSGESAFSRAYKSWTGHPPGVARSQRSSHHPL